MTPSRRPDMAEETCYGLEGILTYTVNGQTMEGRPGDTVLIPCGAIHCFENLHSTPAKAPAIITPGLLGPEYFREIAAVLQSTPPGTPPDLAAIGEIIRRHGLTPAPKPSSLSGRVPIFATAPIADKVGIAREARFTST